MRILPSTGAQHLMGWQAQEPRRSSPAERLPPAIGTYERNESEDRMEDNANENVKAERDAANIADVAKVDRRLHQDRETNRAENRRVSSERIEGSSVLGDTNLPD